MHLLEQTVCPEVACVDGDRRRESSPRNRKLGAFVFRFRFQKPSRSRFRLEQTNQDMQGKEEEMLLTER